MSFIDDIEVDQLRAFLELRKRLKDEDVLSVLTDPNFIGLFAEPDESSDEDIERVQKILFLLSIVRGEL